MKVLEERAWLFRSNSYGDYGSEEKDDSMLNGNATRDSQPNGNCQPDDIHSNSEKYEDCKRDDDGQSDNCLDTSHSEQNGTVDSSSKPYEKSHGNGQQDINQDTGQPGENQDNCQPDENQDNGQAYENQGSGQPDGNLGSGKPDENQDNEKPGENQEESQPDESLGVGQPDENQDIGQQGEYLDNGQPDVNQDNGQPDENQDNGQPDGNQGSGQPNEILNNVQPGENQNNGQQDENQNNRGLDENQDNWLHNNTHNETVQGDEDGNCHPDNKHDSVADTCRQQGNYLTDSNAGHSEEVKQGQDQSENNNGQDSHEDDSSKCQMENTKGEDQPGVAGDPDTCELKGAEQNQGSGRVEKATVPDGSEASGSSEKMVVKEEPLFNVELSKS